MQRIVLQVPMEKELKEKAEVVSRDFGFSSLQETIRVLLTKLSRKELTLRITDQTEDITYLSAAAEKRYKKAAADIKAGKNVTRTKNVNELLSSLH